MSQTVTKKMLQLFLIIYLQLSLFLSEKTLRGIEIQLGDGTNSVFVSFSSSVSIHRPIKTRLYLPNDSEGCKKPLNLPNKVHSWTAVIKRGGSCTFREKILNAQDAGATAVLIVNNIKALYNSSSGALLDPCSLNCEKGKFELVETCEKETSCFNCAENFNLNSNQFCCVEDEVIDMYVGKNIDIPAMFVSIEDGERLIIPAAKQRLDCTIMNRPLFEVDPSVLIIGFLGCFVLLSASYRAVSKERAKVSWMWGSSLESNYEPLQEKHEDSNVEQVHLSISSSAVFVLMSTCALLLLFFLVQYYPHRVVQVLQIFFAIGATESVAKVIIQPILRFSIPSSLANRNCLCLTPSFCVAEDGQSNFVHFISIILGASLSICWLVFRHHSWAWIISNILAASLVVSFLIAVRLPSLKVGAALLSIFFFYDIFMVFFYPYDIWKIGYG